MRIMTRSISPNNKAEIQKSGKVITPSRKSIELADEAIIRREMKVYEDNKEEYLEKYEGKYIAMLNGVVLDSSDSISELAERVYTKFGYRAIFMTLVTRRTKPYRIS